LTAALCFLAMFAASLAGVLAGDRPWVLVPISTMLLIGSVLIARSAAFKTLGTKRTLCVLFFLLATAHALLGYFFAGLSAETIWIGSRANVYYAQAMLINGIGLLAGAVGYSWKLKGKPSSVISTFLDAANDESVLRLCRLLLICGAVLMLATYWRLGFADFLSDPTKWPAMRYVTSDLFGGSSRDEWIISRAMDLITFSLPFVLFRVVKRPRALDILLAAAGSLALLMPLRRANPLSVVLVLLILIGIDKQNVYRIVLKAVFSVAVVYSLTQCLFLLVAPDGYVSAREVLAISSTGLPEVRDLGWILSLLGNERLNGATFVQAALPIPSIATDWSQRNGLRAVTTKLIGLDREGQTGGLRLTLTGEGYINFGYCGAIVVGFLWGMAVGWSDRLFRATGKNAPGFVNYAASLFFIWVCFWLYLAGSQAAASIKGGAILLIAVGLVGKVFQPTLRKQAEIAC
jgi:hypothetical protein